MRWWILENLASEKFVLASESNLSLATGLASWKVSLKPCHCMASLKNLCVCECLGYGWLCKWNLCTGNACADYTILQFEKNSTLNPSLFQIWFDLQSPWNILFHSNWTACSQLLAHTLHTHLQTNLRNPGLCFFSCSVDDLCHLLKRCCNKTSMVPQFKIN